MDYHVFNIQCVASESKTCIQCNGLNLKKNVVIETNGIDTYLCLVCETLMILSGIQLMKLSLQPSAGNRIIFRTSKDTSASENGS